MAGCLLTLSQGVQLVGSHWPPTQKRVMCFAENRSGPKGLQKEPWEGNLEKTLKSGGNQCQKSKTKNSTPVFGPPLPPEKGVMMKDMLWSQNKGHESVVAFFKDLSFQFGTLINIASTFPWHPPNQTKWAGRCIPPCRIGSCTRTPPNLRMTSHWGASVLPNRSALLTTCFGDQTCYPLHPMGLAGRQFFALPPVCPLPAPALTPADRAEGLIRLPRAHLLSLIEP